MRRALCCTGVKRLPFGLGWPLVGGVASSMTPFMAEVGMSGSCSRGAIWVIGEMSRTELYFFGSLSGPRCTTGKGSATCNLPPASHEGREGAVVRKFGSRRLGMATAMALDSLEVSSQSGGSCIQCFRRASQRSRTDFCRPGWGLDRAVLRSLVKKREITYTSVLRAVVAH